MTADDIIQFAPKAKFQSEAWAKGHMAALVNPTPREAALIEAARGIDSLISTWFGPGDRDYVLGEAIAHMIEGWRALLNGDLGRMDGGTLDAWACRQFDRIGWDGDTSDWRK